VEQRLQELLILAEVLVEMVDHQVVQELAELVAQE
jgi:hypothetical protein